MYAEKYSYFIRGMFVGCAIILGLFQYARFLGRI